MTTWCDFLWYLFVLVFERWISIRELDTIFHAAFEGEVYKLSDMWIWCRKAGKCNVNIFEISETFEAGQLISFNITHPDLWGWCLKFLAQWNMIHSVTYCSQLWNWISLLKKDNVYSLEKNVGEARKFLDIFNNISIILSLMSNFKSILDFDKILSICFWKCSKN